MATTVDDTLAHETYLVQFFGGGSPLSPQERADLAASLRKTTAVDPAGVEAAAQDAAGYIKLLSTHRGPALETGRELGRYEVAFGGSHALGPGELGRTATRIIEAHDPVVLADAAKKELVTMQTVKTLVVGNRFGAAPFKVPAPGADAEATLAASIRRLWSQQDEGMREALSHAVRYVPYAEPYLVKAIQSVGPNAPFFANVHGMIMKAPDAAGQQFNLAEVMASTGRSAYKKGGAAAGDTWDHIAHIHNRQALIDRAGRASMMDCGVPAGAVQGPEKKQFCNPSLLP